MKYIVTETQLKRVNNSFNSSRLEKDIFDFFDENLTPDEGWKRHKDYKSELEDSSGELFLDLSYGDKHIWYSICDNQNLDLPIPQGHCPLVSIPDSIYNSLNGYFGKYWIDLFRKWFYQHTGLEVIQVDGW
jgi:hypothetical protein